MYCTYYYDGRVRSGREVSVVLSKNGRETEQRASLSLTQSVLGSFSSSVDSYQVGTES